MSPTACRQNIALAANALVAGNRRSCLRLALLAAVGKTAGRRRHVPVSSSDFCLNATPLRESFCAASAMNVPGNRRAVSDIFARQARHHCWLLRVSRKSRLGGGVEDQEVGESHTIYLWSSLGTLRPNLSDCRTNWGVSVTTRTAMRAWKVPTVGDLESAARTAAASEHPWRCISGSCQGCRGSELT